MRLHTLVPCILLPLVAATAVFSSRSASPRPVEEPPPAPREFRAAWIATVDNIDWPTKRGLPADQQKKELIQLLDLAKKLKFNAVILQVRPHADALYESSLEPWSEYLTAVQGKSPGYDPLQFAVEEAHKRGLELHAWFNPYRAWHQAAKSKPDRAHITVTRPDLVRKYGTHVWLDPGEKEVQEWSLKVMLDVVKRYDIDGLHIDDYFYPYPVRDKAGKPYQFPDDPSWTKYKVGGGKLNRNDWRRDNVNRFVERLYKDIKKEKRLVKFGISPFGIYRPGIPKTIDAGIDQYAELYADAKKWLNEGWCDYYTPQLYWKIDKKPQSYPVLLKWWTEQNLKGRHLWPGNSSSNLFTQKWPATEIVNQIKKTRAQDGATGNVFFSIKAFRWNSGGVNEALLGGPYALPALPPASPWLDNSKPKAPKVSLSKLESTVVMTIESVPSDASLLSLYTKRKGQWVMVEVMSAAVPWAEIDSRDLEAVAIASVDRAGNESVRAIVEIGP